MFEDYADEFDLEEELHYGPIKCDYCYIEYEPEEISYCEDPNLEEVKDYVYVKLFNICDSCCHQRVEEEECDYNSCSVFQKNFVNIQNDKTRIISGTLNLRGKNISHLDEIKGLNKLKNLKYLDLSSNNITHINGKGFLERINDLKLYGNPIERLNNLSDLKSIQRLGLGNCQIVDLSGIKEFKNLKWIDLSNNKIENLIPLRGLNKLNYLNLGRNLIKNLKLQLGIFLFLYAETFLDYVILFLIGL